MVTDLSHTVSLNWSSTHIDIGRRWQSWLQNRVLSSEKIFLICESVWILSFPFHVIQFILSGFQIVGNFSLFEMGENCVLQAAEQKIKVTEQELLC
jgi:hypothetical protein